MPFAIPMIWREPKDHSSDCYFCRTNIQGFTSKTKCKVVYADLISAMRPILNSEEYPVPMCGNVCLSDTYDFNSDPIYGNSSLDPHLLTQEDLNDMVRDLNLSKQQSELMCSGLKSWNLLNNDVRICSYRTHDRDFIKFCYEKCLTLPIYIFE